MNGQLALCAHHMTSQSNHLQHIGIIMDGNGRWANQRGQLRTNGHCQGAKNTLEIIRTALDLDIPHLSLYAFSTENWKRPEDEIKTLMQIFDNYLENEILYFLKRGVRFRAIGNLSRLSKKTKFLIQNAQRISKKNNKMVLNLAISYGGHDEIIRAIKKMATQQIDFDQLDQKTLEAYLDTHDSPPVDLIIRTSGEKRLSNFLVWQAAYAEYYFTDVLWPQFDRTEFLKALDNYHQRNRRFGDISSEPSLHSEKAL